MIVAIAKKNNIVKSNIGISNNANYLIKDPQNNVIGNIVYVNNAWVLNTSNRYQIMNSGNPVYSINVESNSAIEINDTFDHEKIYIFLYDLYSTEVIETKISKNVITVGRSAKNDICYEWPWMKEESFKLTLQNGFWLLESIGDNVFVNDRMVKRKRIDYGDVLFAYGLKLFFVNDIVVVHNTIKLAKVKLSDCFSKKEPISQEVKKESFAKEDEQEVFTPEEEFLRSPRFTTSVKPYSVKFVAPPQTKESQQMPAILTVGPQLTMMLSSGVTIFSSLTQVISGQSTMAQILPSLILSITMMVSSLLWPTLTRRYTRRMAKKNRIKGIRLYRAYLDKKDKEIANVVAEQKQVWLENNVTLEECQQMIFQRKRTLWERTLKDKDFLEVRLGVGLRRPEIDFNYDKKDFGMDEDQLTEELDDIINKYQYVPDSPVSTSFLENRISAIVGNSGLLRSFMESVLLQLLSFHMYSELKIVIFSDENHVKDWDFLKFAPHCWDNGHNIRFIASNSEDKNKLSVYLESIINDRLGSENEDNPDSENKPVFQPYFLIITDNITEARKFKAINLILENAERIGMSLIIKNNRIANLPSQCSTFINITNEQSGLFKNNLSADNQIQFNADFNTTINVEDCVRELANIYVNVPLDKHELPKSVGFLSMYGAGNVSQLNSEDRWRNNNPVVSLSVPVGIDQNGELFNFDIHEKAYGPHGLVAGTTGSGKSEWLITYILSLCVNFSPEEVQFVLIDYKGGGLAGSFDNKETGMHLPHLVGTITNLDKSEIRRSLASLDAESKRRQRMFNQAREKLNDSSMNIYKYQQYYRKGLLDEPLSHLFIISDEFAELKSQEPEFLDQLVSIARIGRSLGIHLILATQKPAGVVTDQINSNSRFKICLRVQEKQDSKDMINVDDAAYLHQTGAFYMLVGLNEVFTLGQSAYSGGLYKPTSIVKKEIETSINILNQTGDVIDTLDHIEQTETDESNVHGEELLNIILYVSDISSRSDMKIRRLWLDAMPETIYLDNIKKKFGFERHPFEVTPIIGQYDDPYRQSQYSLQLDLRGNNTYITGISGSGKEQLIQAMLYSIITNYTPQEVAIYIIDLGSEVFGSFNDSPHVGGIAYSTETEKIKNILRFANKELRLRRKKYRDFGGSYDSYIKYSEAKDPLMIFVINIVENLAEILPEEYENLNALFKDCSKYGIVFVCSAIDPSGIKGKALASFSQTLVLKQSNDDYTPFFGSGARGITPKDLKGRGLFEKDNVIYEFQAGTICLPDKHQQVMKAVNDQLNNYYKSRVVPIPMIPRSIDITKISNNNLSINRICVGYSKATIEPYYMDLQKNFGTCFVAPKKYNLTEYTKTLYQELDLVASDTNKVYIFDPTNIMKAMKFKNAIYVESEEVVNTFNNLGIFINDEYEKYNSLEDKSTYKAPRRSLLVFHQISQIFNLLGNKQDEFESMVEHARELGLFDFIVADIASDFKDVYRNKGISKILLDSNGVLLGNIFDAQPFVELNTRDIKQKDALKDNEGYIVENGRGYMAQMLEFTVQGESEDEV